MKGALYPGPVIGGELADAGYYVFYVLLGDLAVAQYHLLVGVTRLRQPTQVEHDLQQIEVVGTLAKSLRGLRRQNVDEGVEVIGDFQHESARSYGSAYRLLR